MRAVASPPAAAAAAATEQVWDLVSCGVQAVVVDSPPGAGKSTLVCEIAKRLAASGAQVPVVAQTNDQADDLAYGLAAQLGSTGAAVGRLHGGSWRPRTQGPDPAAATPVCSPRIADLDECVIVVATAAKWSYVVDRQWPLGIVDEAYQMSSAALVRTAALFDRLLLVGDPGQLEPFTVADERTVRRVATWPLDTAAGTVLRHHPETPVVALPVSWRLPPSAAAIVSAAFYRRPFAAGTGEAMRRMWFSASPLPDAVGRTLTVAAGSGWGMLQLPAAYVPHTDPEAVVALSDVVSRLLDAAPMLADEQGQRRCVPGDIAVGVTYRDQRALVRAALDAAGLAEVTVETANRLQGREFAVTVAWHPLSGRRDASAFHLESGRLCVLASRHRHACIVVTRVGVREQLDSYPAAEPVWLGVDPPQIDGWEANHRFMEHLTPYAVQA